MKKEVFQSADNNGATVTVEELARDLESGFVLQRHTSTPGFLSTRHSHTDFEWVAVAKGILKDGSGTYPEGTLKINEKGSVHTPFTETGCVLYIFSRGTHAPVEDK